MHETKKKAIEEAEKRCAATKDLILDVKNVFFELGFRLYVSTLGKPKVSLCKDVNSLDDMYSLLCKARRIEPFDLVSYWIPYAGMVCIEYIATLSPGINVLFSVRTEDEDALIAKISAGKCRIEDVISKTVVFGI